MTVSSSPSRAAASRWLSASAVLAAFALLTGCPARSGDTGEAPNMEEDLARTIAEQPEFYRFKDLAAIPDGITWRNGDDIPEFADPNARQGGTFRYYITDFPRTIRTIGPDATGGIRPYLLDYIGIAYLHPHPNLPGEVYPGLAREWALHPETRQVFFRLNQDARWSDGQPFTTDDVVFTFYFMRSPHLREPWYNDFYTKNYDAITIYDSHTFAITLAEWKPDAVIRAGNLVPYARHAFQDFGKDWIERFQWRTLPTTGAYQLLDSGIRRGRSITLTRVPDWWANDKRFFRGRFNPENYHLEVIRDPDKALESFTRGDLDMMGLGLPKWWYESLPDNHTDVVNGYIVKTTFYNQIPRPDWGLWINSAQPLLNQRDIRLGIQYATNFDLICQQYFRGDAVRLQTRSDGYGWHMNPEVSARPFDNARAREAFARAGFDQQGPDGILRNAAGQRLSFTITTYARTLQDMLPILQQEARKAGLDLRLEVLDATTGWKKVQEKNHEIALVALARSVEMYPRYWEMYHGSNAYEDAYLGPDGQPVARFADGRPNPNPQRIRVQTNNMTSTFIPELDQLIEAYDRADTMDEVKRLAAKIEKIIYDEASWVNGWATPFHRTGYWSYVRWPEGFNAMRSRTSEEFFLFWIDEDAKAELERDLRNRTSRPQQVLVFDQYKD